MIWSEIFVFGFLKAELLCRETADERKQIRTFGHGGRPQISGESPLINVSARDKALLYASACLRSSHCHQNHFWGQRTAQLPLAGRKRKEKKRSKSSKTAAAHDCGEPRHQWVVTIGIVLFARVSSESHFRGRHKRYLLEASEFREEMSVTSVTAWRRAAEHNVTTDKDRET